LVSRARETTPGWKPLRIGAGGFITGMGIANDGTKVIRTDTYGAYIWGGTEWEQLITSTKLDASYYEPGEGGGGVYSIAIAPSDSDRIYLIWGGYLYKSADGGGSFTRTSFTYRSNLDPNDSYRTYTGKMAVDPADPNVVYAGTVSNGLFRTLDGGTNWASVAGVTAGATAGHCGIAFDPSSGTTNGRTNVIYAGSYGNGVWRSADAGETWTRISSTMTSCSAGVVGNTSGVYYCVSGTTFAKYSGSSWTTMDTSSFQDRTVTVAVTPSDNTKVVLSIDGGSLAVSTNSGSSWDFKGWTTSRTATDIPWLAWTNEGYMSTAIIVADPVTSGRLWFAEGIGVWYTDNVDASPSAWTSQSRGIEQLVASWLWSVPGGALFAGAWDRPVFRITDPDTFPSTHGTNRDHSIIKGYSVEHAVDDTSFIVADANWFENEESSYSTDGGVTWTKFASAPAFTPTAGGGHIAVSTTTNWVWLSNANKPGYYTTNGGTSWTKLSFPSPFVDDASTQGWGGFDAQLYLNRHVVCADRVTTGTFYAYHNGETSPSVFRSTNGGATWTRVYSSRLTSYVLDYWNGKLKAVPGKAGHLFWTPGHAGGTNPSSGSYLMRSTDGGESWSAVPNLLEVYDVGFGKTPSGGSYPSVHVIGWLSGTYGVYRSDDNCATWTSLGAYPLGSLDSLMCISGDENVEGRTYVGFGGSGFAYYG
jgi:hypothetical protein